MLSSCNNVVFSVWGSHWHYLSSLPRVMEHQKDQTNHNTLTTRSLLQKEARQKRRMVQLQKRAEKIEGTNIYRSNCLYCLYWSWKSKWKFFVTDILIFPSNTNFSPNQTLCTPNPSSIVDYHSSSTHGFFTTTQVKGTTVCTFPFDLHSKLFLNIETLFGGHSLFSFSPTSAFIPSNVQCSPTSSSAAANSVFRTPLSNLSPAFLNMSSGAKKHTTGSSYS